MLTLRIVPGRVVGVIDGDTLLVDIDLGWRLWRHREPVRIANISCDEKHTPAGRAARSYADELIIQGQGCELHVLKWQEKYGRTLGLVTINGGQDFGGLMIQGGHARPGDGKKGLVTSLFMED
jgi:endonuclease YncB( thermonuclease family)